MIKKLLAGAGLASAALAILAAPLAANAADFAIPREQDNGNVTIHEAESRHNLYAAGGTVTIDGAATGDLYAAGGTILANGPVEQDLVLGGGTVYINGKVGGDVRVAGGTITINGPVAGDVVVFGGTVTLTEKASVGGDLIVNAGSLTVNGPVTGQTRLNGGDIAINSALAGPLTVRANNSLSFGPQASVPGDINYTGANKPAIDSAAKVGPVNQQVPPKRNFRGSLAGFVTVALLLKILGWIAAALVLLQFFRNRTGVVTEMVYHSPWLNLGMGFLTAVALPVAALILLIVAVGYYIAILLFLFYALVGALSVLVAAIFLGALVIKWLTNKPQLVLDWQAVVIGVVGFILIALIPFVGWVIDAVLVLMVFGALIRMTKDAIKGQKNMAIISE